MDGVLIDQVKYIDGHADLGRQNIRVKLVAFPTNLTIFDRESNDPLFSIPWGSFKSAWVSTLSKKGIDSVVSFVIDLVPGIGILSQAAPFYYGIYISFNDEELQRVQKVFFATGSDHKSDKVVRNIIQYRDNYYRSLNRSSGPRRRK